MRSISLKWFSYNNSNYDTFPCVGPHWPLYGSPLFTPRIGRQLVSWIGGACGRMVGGALRYSCNGISVGLLSASTALTDVAEVPSVCLYPYPLPFIAVRWYVRGARGQVWGASKHSRVLTIRGGASWVRVGWRQLALLRIR